MTALDFSAYESAGDSEELKAFKEKVKAVANKYTRIYGWCGEVKKALIEIGVEVEPVLASVKVTTGTGFELIVMVDPKDFEGLSEEEEVQLVLDKIGSIQMKSSSVSGALTIKPEHVETMEVLAPDDEPATTGPVVAWRSSATGRVAHAFSADQINAPTDMWAFYMTACGNEVYATNVRSERNTGDTRHCANCTRVLEQSPRTAEDSFGMSRNYDNERAYNIPRQQSRGTITLVA